MRGLTVSLRFFITMYGLSSLNSMNCTCYVVISPSILRALLEPHLMTVVDNELTIFSFSLVRLDMVVEYCCILDMICHTMPCLWFLNTWNCHCTIVVATTFVYVYCTVQLHHSPCFATAILCRKLTFLSTLILYSLVILNLIK